jgi:fucose 4-O-acetylase-like acetyltransferase
MEHLRKPDRQIRLKYLDIAKGIGIILVMMSHSCGFPIGGYYLTAHYMALFFLISGCVYKSGRTLGNNVRNRLVQLLHPYIFYSVLLLIACIAIGRLQSFSDIVKAIEGIIYSRYCLYYPLGLDNNTYFSNIYNSAMWFLTAMFCSSVIFYLLIEHCLENKNKLVITCVALITITCALSQIPVLLPWSIDTSFIGAFFMTIGCLLERKHYFERKFDVKYAGIIIITFLIYITFCRINRA